MVIAVKIDRERLKKARELSKNFKKRGLDPRPAMKTISLSLLRSTSNTFRKGGRPRWPPLAPLTLALRRKGRRSGSAKPLRDTGRLFQSIKNFFTKLTGGIGTNLSYASIHQKGGFNRFPARTVKVKKHTRDTVFGQIVPMFVVKAHTRNVKARTAKIPRRQFMSIFDQDVRRALRIMKNFIIKGKPNE